MELDSAMLAMGADHNKDGLLHIFGGGFDSLEVLGKVPAQLMPFWMVARAIAYGVPADEVHFFKVTGINPVGEPFNLTTEEGFQFRLAASDPGEISKATIIIQVQMVVKHEGKYQFILSIDGVELKRIDLKIAVKAA